MFWPWKLNSNHWLSFGSSSKILLHVWILSHHHFFKLKKKSEKRNPRSKFTSEHPLDVLQNVTYSTVLLYLNFLYYIKFYYPTHLLELFYQNWTSPLVYVVIRLSMPHEESSATVRETVRSRVVRCLDYYQLFRRSLFLSIKSG